MLVMMLFLAVTAVALNRRAGLQARMAGNQIKSSQTSLGRTATLEKTIWDLTQDPLWRTAIAGEDYVYDGVTYTRKVLDATAIGYTDAVTASVSAKGATASAAVSMRYNLTDFLYMIRPQQLCIDTFNNTYVADGSSHSVYLVDDTTAALSRVAGNGTSGFSGDGGQATQAQLNNPKGVWKNVFGSIYIADTDNHRIRKVDLNGNITTVAGNGSPGFSGDGGAATDATLRLPTTLAADSQGNIYVADTDNHCIRKIDTAGTITTVAGTGGVSGYSGDGGTATAARLDSPQGVAIDAAGNIYIADTGNGRIRKVETDGDIKRIAGCTSGFGCRNDDPWFAMYTILSSPRGIYVDNTSGLIYFADSDHHRIRCFQEGSWGLIWGVAGNGSSGYSGDGGAATSAQLDRPWSAAIKSTGELVVADWMNACLRQVDNAGDITTATAKGDPGYNQPAQVVMDASGNVYIADTVNNRIRKLDAAGKVTTVAGTGAAGFSGDGGQATAAQLNIPEGLALDASGNIYIADTGNHTIRKVDSAGDISTVAGTGLAGDSGDGGSATAALLNGPKGVYVDTSDNIYIADTQNCRIRMVSASTGNIERVAGKPGSITCNFDSDSGPATSRALNKPGGVFVDTSGNFYIADTDSHIIRKVTSGQISTIAGTAETSGYSGDGGAAISATLSSPKSVFVDTAGNIFVADQGNDVIRVVSVGDGNIHTLAGTGTGGFNGDDLPAVEAQLNSPGGVVMAATRGGRKIYISDTANNRIRYLTWKLEKKVY